MKKLRFLAQQIPIVVAFFIVIEKVTFLVFNLALCTLHMAQIDYQTLNTPGQLVQIEGSEWSEIRFLC